MGEWRRLHSEEL